MTQARRARGSARRQLCAAVAAGGTFACSFVASLAGLASCASGGEDVIDTADGAALLERDAMTRSPDADTGGLGVTKLDAHPGNGDRDAGAAEDGAVSDDVGAASDASPAPDTSVPNGGDGGSTCGGLNEWFAGTTELKVKHFGETYTCVVSGWCSESSTNGVAAYEPGKGWAWTEAWQDSGPCPSSN